MLKIAKEVEQARLPKEMVEMMVARLIFIEEYQLLCSWRQLVISNQHFLLIIF